MLQLILSFLPMLAVIASVFALAFRWKCSGISMEQTLDGLGLGIENSPAQVAFFMFSFAAAVAAAFTGAFSHVSNQLILSLDILFFLSSLLLVLLHQFKEFPCASL